MSDPDFFRRLNADEQGYAKLAEWLKNTAGIHMPASPKNFTLMAARLVKMMERQGLKNYSALHRRLLQGEGNLRQSFIEALTTNMTEFFREAHHFAVLPQAMREVLASKGQTSSAADLRIWCAAASRGHEPYSILFTILEAGFDPKIQRLKFLASDIDQTVLEVASKGVYKQDDLHGVPRPMRDKYMVRLKTAGAVPRWKVRDELRELVTFAPVNLVDFPYPFQHKFDLIFCRNVLIYFDRDTSLRVKEHLAGALAESGYLFIGHSETGSARVEALESVDAAVFKKRKEAS